MDIAVANRQRIATIRRQLIAGMLTYDQALEAATPVVDSINNQSISLAIKLGLAHKPVQVKACIEQK